MSPSRAVSLDALHSSGIERSALRRLGIAVLCVKVILVPLVFHQAFDVPFTVPKALLSHALAYVLAGILAGLVIRHGVPFVVRSWVHIPVVGFLVLNMVATLFAVDRELALYGTHVRMLGLGTIADWVILYAAVSHLVRTRREVILVAACCFAATLPVLGYEFVQLAGRDPLTWSIDTALSPTSTMGQATILAEYLVVLAIGAFAAGVLAENLGRGARVALLTFSVLLLTGSAVTGTRSALLGLVAGAATFVVLTWVRHPSSRARLLSMSVAVVTLVGLAGVVFLSPVGTRLAGTFDSGTDEDGLGARLEPSAAGRLTIYEIALRMVSDRPIIGYGPDNFVVGVPRYRPPAAPDNVRQSLATSAHGWPTQIASTSGVLGLAAFIAIGAAAVLEAVRRPFRPVAITAVAMLAAFFGAGATTVSEIGVDWLFWAAAGAVAFDSKQRVAPSVDKPGRRSGGRRARAQVEQDRVIRGPRLLAIGLCVLIGSVLASTSFAALEASRLAQTSSALRLRGVSNESIDLALRATRTDGGRAEYWDILGLAYAGASQWREAATSFERATTLMPYNVRYIGDQASARLGLYFSGDNAARARAIQLGDDAVRVDPNNPRAHLTRATVRQATGDVVEALRSAERALALDPHSVNPRLYFVTIQLLVADARAADALRVAREGVDSIGRRVESMPIRIQLARLLVASGRVTEAISELDLALTIAPDSEAEKLRNEIRATQ